MIEKPRETNKPEKLGIIRDPLSLDDLPAINAEHGRKLMPMKINYGYPRTKIRKGRPYYYLVWYEKVEGKRKQRSLYLGATLPKGYSLGRAVKITTNKHPPQTGVVNEAEHEENS